MLADMAVTTEMAHSGPAILTVEDPRSTFTPLSSPIVDFAEKPGAHDILVDSPENGIRDGDNSSRLDPLWDFMKPVHRVHLVFKSLQFFLVTFLISSMFFKNHGIMVPMMSNPRYAVMMLITITGMMTHLRYKKLFTVSTSVPLKNRLYIYLALRFGYLLPAYFVGLFLAIFTSHDAGLKQFILNATGTTSLFVFAPFRPINETLAYSSNPYLLIGSAVGICWLCYPLVARCIQLTTNLPFLSRELNTTLLLSTTFTLTVVFPLISAVFFAYYPVSGIPFEKDTWKVAAMLGSAGFFLHPIFSLHLFICGVLLIEVSSRTSFLDSSSAEPHYGRVLNFLAKWIYPYLIYDVLTLFIFAVMIAAVNNGFTNFRKLQDHLAFFLYNFPNFGTKGAAWNVSAPLLLYPVVCISFLLSLSPFSQRSLTQIILTQPPILGVSPGRTATNILFLTLPAFRLCTPHFQNNLYNGAGIMLFTFLVFIIAVPFYYYVQQPIQIFFAVHCAGYLRNLQGSHDESEIPTAPNTPKAADTDAVVSENELLPMTMTSPNYDAFDLKKMELDKRIWKFVFDIPRPKFSWYRIHNLFEYAFVLMFGVHLIE